MCLVGEFAGAGRVKPAASASSSRTTALRSDASRSSSTCRSGELTSVANLAMTCALGLRDGIAELVGTFDAWPRPARGGGLLGLQLAPSLTALWPPSLPLMEPPFECAGARSDAI